MICLLDKLLGLVIVPANDIKRAVAIMILQAIRQHILRACQQDMLVPQREEIRALPHQPDPVVVLDQGMGILPVKPICALIHQHLPAAALDIVGDQRPVNTVLSAPDLRITERVFIAALRQILLCQYGIVLVFLIIRSISKRKALQL